VARGSLGAVLSKVYRTHWRSRSDDARQEIADILNKAAEEIETVLGLTPAPNDGSADSTAALLRARGGRER